jgi:hypothetical protein
VTYCEGRGIWGQGQDMRTADGTLLCVGGPAAYGSVATVQKAVAASCRLVSVSVRVSEVQSAGEIPGGVSVSV